MKYTTATPIPLKTHSLLVISQFHIKTTPSFFFKFMSFPFSKSYIVLIHNVIFYLLQALAKPMADIQTLTHPSLQPSDVLDV